MKKFFNVPRWLIISSVIAIIALSIPFFRASCIDGKIVPPLDDTYIHCQYARSIAENHPLRYSSPEDNITTGATSLLYILLLSVGYSLGFTGNGLLVFALILNFVFLFFGVLSAYHLGKNLKSSMAGIISAVLIIFCPALLWGLWSGMEVTLVASLLLLTLYRLSEEDYISSCFFATCLALSRPEGWVASGIIVFYILLKSVKKIFLNTGENKDKKIFLLLFLPVIVGLLPWFIAYISRGTLQTTSISAKSIWSLPYRETSIAGDLTIRNLKKILSVIWNDSFGGIQKPFYMFPLSLLFIFAGFIFLFKTKGKRCYALLFLSILFSWILLSSTTTTWDLHNYRYLLPILPLSLILSGIGIDFAGGLHSSIKKILSILLLSLVVILWVTQIGMVWFENFKNDTNWINDCQVTLAEKANEELPSDAKIAINDAGALAYFGNRQVVDLVGLVSNDCSPSFRMGMGALFERLERIPPEKRFTHYIVFRSWFDPFFQTGMVGDTLFEYVHPEHPEHYSMVCVEAKWDKIGRAWIPLLRAREIDGWSIVDQVDIADIVDEEIHGYKYSLGGPIENPDTLLINYIYCDPEGIDHHNLNFIDGGRVIPDWESFNFHCNAGYPICLQVRYADTRGEFEQGNIELEVTLGDNAPERWILKTNRWRWNEAIYIFPAEKVTRWSYNVKIKVKGGTTPYIPFYYWVWQPPVNSN